MRFFLLLCALCMGCLSQAVSPASAQWRPSALEREGALVILPEPGGTATPHFSAALRENTVEIPAQQVSGRQVALGAVVGALAGTLLFLASSDPCSGDVMFCEVSVVGYAALGAWVGGFAAYNISRLR